MSKKIKRLTGAEWVHQKDGCVYVKSDFFQNKPSKVAALVGKIGAIMLIGNGPKNLSCRILPTTMFSDYDISRFLPVGASDINRNWPSLKSLVKYEGVILAYQFKGEILGIVEKNPDYKHEATDKYRNGWVMRNASADNKAKTAPVEKLDKIYELLVSMNIVWGAVPAKIEEVLRLSQKS